jgi:hypothetical protein
MKHISGLLAVLLLLAPLSQMTAAGQTQSPSVDKSQEPGRETGRRLESSRDDQTQRWKQG